MCGHVGIAGKIEYKDEAIMKKLLVFDVFRGPDSTGLASFRKNGDVHIAKVASHPINLFGMKKFDTTLSGFNSKVLLGHNRLATKGAVNDINAHPYHYGHIVGAHNGTLDKSSWKALEELAGEETDVDSQAIFLAISKAGIEAVVPLLQGAWALVWIDTNENTLNFLRNKERPFWYGYSEACDKVLWGSEYPIIAAAVDLSNEKMFRTNDNVRFWASAEDMWYKFDLGKLAAGSTTRPKPTCKQLKGKEPAPAVNYSCGHPPFQRGAGTGKTEHSTGSRTTNHSTTTTLHTSTDSKIVELVGYKARPFGGYLSKEQFDRAAKYGCSHCEAEMQFDEPGVTFFEEDDIILCPDCSPHLGQNRLYVNDVNRLISAY